MVTRVEILTTANASGERGRCIRLSNLPVQEVLRVAADCGIVSQTRDVYGSMVSVEGVSRSNLERLLAKLHPLVVV